MMPTQVGDVSKCRAHMLLRTHSGGRMRTRMFDNGRLVVMLEPGPLNAVKHSKMTRLCHAAQPLCGLQCDGNRLCMRVSCVQL